MTDTPSSINADRLHANFKRLARIGATAAGGIDRPALSPTDIEARAWFRGRVEAAGLLYRCDAAGNQSARLAGHSDKAPQLIIGSHLDSVPNGGCYDGALGVLAALEVLQILQEKGYAGAVGIEAINFTDEEGTHIGCLGSRALTGQLSPEDLQKPLQGRDELNRGLARLGLGPEGLAGARRDPQKLAGYLELHIEQGPRLIRGHETIGIVSAIVGLQRFRLRFRGRADHAGTTPVGDRRDAGRTACIFAARAWDILDGAFPECVANIGAIRLGPGAFNVVPATAVLDLEIRAPATDMLAALEKRLKDTAVSTAARGQVTVEVEVCEYMAASRMDTGIQAMLTAIADQMGFRHRLMTSGAGHDAQCFADICPTGMIFIPSIGGCSHVPEEFSRWSDCVNGANFLLQAVLALAEKSDP